MKLVGLFAGALAGVSAQNPAALARLYAQNVERNGSARAVMFAKALEAKIQAYQTAGLEIPAHVTQTVLASVAGGGIGRASPFCPTPGGCTATISLEQIWNYGCWCLLETPDEGNGLTMDSYDAACRDMVKCNRCAAIDTPGCDAANTGFQVNVAWDTAAMGFSMDCSAANADADDGFCAEHLCTCEMNFFSNVLDLLWQGADRTDAFERAQGFDADQCIIAAADADLFAAGAGDAAAPEECCGSYPNRREISGSTACCHAAAGSVDGGLPFQVTEDCCEDGTVEALGDCVV